MQAEGSTRVKQNWCRSLLIVVTGKLQRGNYCKKISKGSVLWWSTQLGRPSQIVLA